MLKEETSPRRSLEYPEIWATVDGDVNNPGLYGIPGEKPTLYDLVQTAGGLKGTITSTTYIPASLRYPIKGGDHWVVTISPDGVRGVKKSLKGAEALIFGHKMPINTAGKEGLMCLPAMSERLAAEIVRYRNEHGPFRSPEELKKVSGVGPKKIRRWKPYIRF